MITAIRDVRRAKGMTLEEVARRCQPPTTAQTVGRLEMGTRTVSVGWLNRIAAALDVTAADLVKLPDRAALPVTAVLDASGASAPRRAASVAPPVPAPGSIAISVAAGVGDYRAGDELWCEMLDPAGYGAAMNRDVLVPRPGGRFLFGRLIGRDGGKLHLLPLGVGSRQQVVTDPPWIARVARLVRALLRTGAPGRARRPVALAAERPRLAACKVRCFRSVRSFSASARRSPARTSNSRDRIADSGSTIWRCWS